MKQPAKILDRMPDAGPAQGQQSKVPKANRGSAAQAMIASTMQGPAPGQQTKDARTAIRRHAVTGNDCETQGAREIKAME